MVQLTSNPNINKDKNKQQSKDIEEKLFKREEIRTMKKDLTRMRERQAGKERENIGDFEIKSKEEKEKEQFEKEKMEKAKEETESMERRKIKEIEIDAMEKKAKEEEEKRKAAEEVVKQRQEQEQEEKKKELLKRTTEEKLVERKIEIKKEFSILNTQKKPLEEEKAGDIKKIEELKILLEPILEKEKKIEEKKEQLDEKERETNIKAEKQKIEEQRWGIEKKRRSIETEKWEIEQKIENINKKIKRDSSDYKMILDREQELEKELENIEKKQKVIDVKKEKQDIEKGISILHEDISPLTDERRKLTAKAAQAKTEFQSIEKQEKEVEQKIEIIEEREKSATSSQEKREIEKQRWEAEEYRQKIEKTRRDIEEKIKDLDIQLKEKEWEIQKNITKESKMKETINEIDEFLRIDAAGGKEKFEEIKRREIEQKKREEEERKQRREEQIKNVEKEEEERKKRERLKKEESQKSAKVVFRPVAKKSSLKEKIWVRFIIIFFLLAVISAVFTFVYWYLTEKQEKSEPPSLPTTEEITFFPKPFISLIPVQKTEVIEAATIEEIHSLFSEILEKSLAADELTRILIKLQSKNDFAVLKDFFQGLNITIPSELEQNLGENWTLFIYPQAQGKRIGFISEVAQKEELKQLLKSWQPSMEKDFEPLFSLLGKEKPATFSFFRYIIHKEVSIRYQTFSKQDLGICYAIYDNYFIWTSSMESIEKVIDKLKK